MKINSTKATEARGTQRKRDICIFDYTMRVIKNHGESNLTRPTGTTFSRSMNLPRVGGLSRVPKKTTFINASIKIILTNLILKLVIQTFYSEARLARLIKIHTKEF